MKRSLALMFSALFLGNVPALAAVDFTEWTPETVGGIVGKAAAEDRLVMVLVTQPDWCPACIELDRRLLRNPNAADVAALTRDWVVLEVLGYDAPGARFLESQGLTFLGTPTTLLLRPSPGQATLGEAHQLVAVVGAPEDYVERLTRAAEGFDGIAAAQAQVRERNDVEAWHALAMAYLEAGDAEAARRAYRSIMVREDLAPEQRRSLSLEAIVQPVQRVAKDHERTLAELDAWVAANPGHESDGGLVYARVWSLMALGRIDEARVEIDRYYIAPGDADSLATYLYLVFRHPTGDLLADAEARAREGIERFPEQKARLSAAHGRLLRRQGRLEEAEAAFEAAVAATDPGEGAYNTYVGQLEYVRREIADRRG
jgi:tetratricopeptide (TPR) repeat protein